MRRIRDQARRQAIEDEMDRCSQRFIAKLIDERDGLSEQRHELDREIADLDDRIAMCIREWTKGA